MNNEELNKLAKQTLQLVVEAIVAGDTEGAEKVFTEYVEAKSHLLLSEEKRCEHVVVDDEDGDDDDDKDSKEDKDSDDDDDDSDEDKDSKDKKKD